MTPNANLTGAKFEDKCVAMIAEHRLLVDDKVRVKWAPRRYYKPDLVTEHEVFEFKYQQVGGSVKNKLTQALFELRLMGSILQKNPILVYDGEVLEDFILNDPAFNAATDCCPNVLIIPFQQLHDIISSSTNCNHRNPQGYLEHAA